MRFVRTLLFLLIAPAVLQAQATAGRPVTIGRTDSIWSPTLKEYRNFLVYTPPGYAQSPYQPRAYPVMYVLDGDAHFHSITGLLQFFSTGINGTYVLPEMIVVAIPNTDRTRDLTPTHATSSSDGTPVPAFGVSGGGAKFLQFIKAELIPHVDSAFRTEPYRVLVGHSLGGITAINALYTMPETFNAYVAIDPSLWWDDHDLLKKAKDFFSRKAPPNRVLFLARANTMVEDDSSKAEHFKSIGQFNSLLQSGNRSGIRYAYKYYSGDDHGSVPLIAEYDALRFIFDGYKLNAQKAAERPALVSEHFARVSERLGYTVQPPEKLVDRLGGEPAKVLEHKRLNVRLYPQSANAFFALGAALLAVNDTTSARAALARATELDPTSPRARELLAKLPTH